MRFFAAVSVPALFLAISAAAGAQNIQVNRENRTIAVTTEGKARAEAEIGGVHVGYFADAATPADAYAKASALSAKIVTALTAAGVDKKAIRSENQSVKALEEYEIKNYPAAEQASHRFRAEQSWTVNVAAVDAAAVLDDAVNAGANSCGNIDWNVKDEDALVAEAAALALRQAREIASGMAAGLGAKLGALVYASNQAPSSGHDRYPIMAGLASSSDMDRKARPKPLAIFPEKIEKSATVFAVFAIE